MRSPRVLLSLILLAGALTFGCAEGGSDLSSQDCLSVRSHVIDLQLARAGGDAAELAKHRRLRMAIDRVAYVDRCRAEQTPDTIACALAAKSLDEYRACK